MPTGTDTPERSISHRHAARRTDHRQLPWAWIVVAVLAALTLLGAVHACQSTHPSVGAGSPPAGRPLTEPLSASTCQADFGARCYTPTQVGHAYGLDRLHKTGLTGAGRTVAVVMPFTNPHAQHDLDVFSDQFGLPRTRIEVIGWSNPTPPASPEQEAIAQETVMDLEMIHAAAPRAHLIYLQAPTALLPGALRLDRLSDATDWLVKHCTVDVISMSWGLPEPIFEEPGKPGDYSLVQRLRRGLVAAHARKATLVAAAGNTGPTGPDLKEGAHYSRPVVAWPASDPLVTAVGGTRLHLSDTDERTAPDQVWTAEGPSATAGGLSAIFPRPVYQDRIRGLTGAHRGVPDIAANASTQSRIWGYSTLNALPGQAPGWVRGAGTSMAAPLIAGIVAAAAQAAGHPLGDINPTLYTANPQRAGLTDLTSGCNTANAVQSFCARPGPDLVSGAGALHDAPRLVALLSGHPAT